MTKEERIDTVMNLWAAGTPFRDIAAAIKETRPSQVHDIVRAARRNGDPRAISGVARGTQGNSRTPPEQKGPEVREAILDAYASGDKQVDIAARMSVCASYVSSVITYARSQADPRAVASAVNYQRRMARERALVPPEEAQGPTVYLTSAGRRILARLHGGKPVDQATLFHASLCTTFDALGSEIRDLSDEVAALGFEIVEISPRRWAMRQVERIAA